jgi:transcriptional regulator with XRE-family HTH domain
LSFDHKKLIGAETHDQLVAGIARVVKARRKAMNLSQCALAERLKMSRPYISKIERGRLLPTIDSLERIAQELGMSMFLLLSLSAVPPSDFHEVFEEVSFPEKILQYFHRANAADQAFFREFAESLFLRREQHM